MAERFDLVAATIERAKAAHISALNRAIWAEDVSYYRPMPAVTWRDHVRWGYLRVRGYFSTLWCALKGGNPYEDDY